MTSVRSSTPLKCFESWNVLGFLWKKSPRCLPSATFLTIKFTFWISRQEVKFVKKSPKQNQLKLNRFLSPTFVKQLFCELQKACWVLFCQRERDEWQFSSPLRGRERGVHPREKNRISNTLLISQSSEVKIFSQISIRNHKNSPQPCHGACWSPQAASMESPQHSGWYCSFSGTHHVSSSWEGNLVSFIRKKSTQIKIFIIASFYSYQSQKKSKTFQKINYSVSRSSVKMKNLLGTCKFFQLDICILSGLLQQ